MKRERYTVTGTFAVSFFALLFMLSLSGGSKGYFLNVPENERLLAQLTATLPDTTLSPLSNDFQTNTYTLPDVDTEVFLNTDTYSTQTQTDDSLQVDSTVADTTSGEVTKQCPFVQKEGVLVVPFGDTVSQGISLRPGLYDILLASAHSLNRGAQQVLNESWHLVLYDEKHTVVLQTNAIRDIRDDERVVMERVMKSAPIPRTVVKARAFFPTDVDRSLQFTPLCASFRFLGDMTDNSGATEGSPTTSLNSSTLQDSFTALQEGNKEAFLEEQESSVRSSLQENRPILTGVTVARENVERTENSSTVESFTESVHGGVTSSAFAHTLEGDSFSSAFAYSKVSRERATAGLETELLSKLEQASHAHREALMERVFSGMGVEGDSLQHVDLSRRSLEEPVEERAQAGDANRTLEAFRIIKRAELGDLTDTDLDGVTDYDEVHIYGTNPFNPYTGNSVLTDGERIVLGLDPLKNDLKTVVVETPRTKGEVREELFTIDSIVYGTDTVTTENEEQRPVKIRGTAPPLSFVTLFVYSTPIVVTVRADKHGAFEYTLEKRLEDGSHEIYVASVNATGKVLVKSQPAPFVKTAEAIEYVPVVASTQQSPVDDAIETMVVFGLLLALLLAIGTVMLIGHFKTVHGEAREEKTNNEGE